MTIFVDALRGKVKLGVIATWDEMVITVRM
jgi:hypothetical protein